MAALKWWEKVSVSKRPGWVDHLGFLSQVDGIFETLCSFWVFGKGWRANLPKLKQKLSWETLHSKFPSIVKVA